MSRGLGVLKMDRFSPKLALKYNFSQMSSLFVIFLTHKLTLSGHAMTNQL